MFIVQSIKQFSLKRARHSGYEDMTYKFCTNKREENPNNQKQQQQQEVQLAA